MDGMTTRCPACGAINRLPAAGLHRPVRCGRCHTSLSTGAGTVTDGTFETEVVGSAIPVLVDCWAPWCGPCRTLAPVIDALAGEYAGRVHVVKLNVDENPAVAARYGIRGVPTLLLFSQGRLRDRLVGVGPRALIAERLGVLLETEVA
jgi:thioredoxin